MSKTKPLPDAAKLDYTTIDGVPVIRIEASLTTRSQVQFAIDQLEKLLTMLPETKVRRAKKPATTRAPRTNNQATQEEKTV